MFKEPTLNDLAINLLRNITKIDEWYLANGYSAPEHNLDKLYAQAKRDNSEALLRKFIDLATTYKG